MSEIVQLTEQDDCETKDCDVDGQDDSIAAIVSGRKVKEAGTYDLQCNTMEEMHNRSCDHQSTGPKVDYTTRYRIPDQLSFHSMRRFQLLSPAARSCDKRVW